MDRITDEDDVAPGGRPLRSAARLELLPLESGLESFDGLDESRICSRGQRSA